MPKETKTEKSEGNRFEAVLFDHGRLTIPQDVREKFSIGRGSRIRLILEEVITRNTDLPKRRKKKKE